MKKVYVILILVFVYQNVIGQIQTQKVKSKITEITVFFTSAEIEREAKVKLKKGMNKLIYYGITPKLEKGSIYTHENKDISVVSINTHKKEIFPDKSKIKNLSDSLLLVNDKVDLLNTEIKVLNKSINILDNNSYISSDDKLDVNQIIALNEYYAKKIRDILHSINKNKEELEKTEQLKQRIDSDLNRIKSTFHKKDEMVIELIVLTTKDISTNINLKYTVGGAGWTPLYVINTSKLESNLKMKLQAKVINQTEINWENIKMKFSTASLNKSQDAPALKTWNLNFNNRIINEGRLDKYRANGISTEEAKKMNKGIDLIEGVKYVQTVESSIKNIYKTTNNYYIPSDSKTYFIDIEEYTLPVRYRYYSIPKVNANAYLIAEITDWEKHNLLEGQTKIWFNGNFVGESYIRPQLALDTLNISLGSDDKIFVNKVKLKDKDSQKIIGNNKKQTFKYRITVKNTNSIPVRFTLQDQLPVAQDNKIKVEGIETSNADFDIDSGSLKWKFNLEPGESKEFIILFSVKFPKNRNIVIRFDRGTSSKYGSVRFL